MAKTTKKRRLVMNVPTVEEDRLRASRLRLQRITREQRAIMGLARKLMKQSAAMKFTLSVLASEIAEDQGFKLEPYGADKAVAG